MGPFGIEALSPEGLFDVHLDAVSNAVLWTLVLNGGAFAVGSLLFPPSRAELARTERLAGLRAGPRAAEGSDASPVIASTAEKRAAAVSAPRRYHGEEDGARLADECLARAGAPRDGGMSAIQLARAAGGGRDDARGRDRQRRCARGAPPPAARARRESRGRSRRRTRRSSPRSTSRPPSSSGNGEYHRERERILLHEAEAQRLLAEVSGQLGASLALEDVARAAVRLPVPQLAEAAVLWLAPDGRRPGASGSRTRRPFARGRRARRRTSPRPASARCRASPARSRRDTSSRTATARTRGWPEPLRAAVRSRSTR